jgi:hypothetical protein
MDEMKSKFNGLMDDLTKKMDGAHAKASEAAQEAKIQ